MDVSETQPAATQSMPLSMPKATTILVGSQAQIQRPATRLDKQITRGQRHVLRQEAGWGGHPRLLLQPCPPWSAQSHSICSPAPTIWPSHSLQLLSTFLVTTGEMLCHGFGPEMNWSPRPWAPTTSPSSLGRTWYPFHTLCSQICIPLSRVYLAAGSLRAPERGRREARSLQ